MWPALVALVRTYAPIIVFPFAFTIGVVGYNLEGWMSDKETPWKKSVIERREDRKDKGEEEFKIPKTVFDRFKEEVEREKKTK